MRKTFYTVQKIEIIRCHLIAAKDRTGNHRFAADSKRDKRRFSEAYANREEAKKKVIENEIKNQSDA